MPEVRPRSRAPAHRAGRAGPHARTSRVATAPCPEIREPVAERGGQREEQARALGLADRTDSRGRAARSFQPQHPDGQQLRQQVRQDVMFGGVEDRHQLVNDRARAARIRQTTCPQRQSPPRARTVQPPNLRRERGVPVTLYRHAEDCRLTTRPRGMSALLRRRDGRGRPAVPPRQRPPAPALRSLRHTLEKVITEPVGATGHDEHVQAA